jgi:tartrate dehydrogenase/decarboxylase/D-malate dehydrogenase
MSTRQIALIPGDGIGMEVSDSARRVLDELAPLHRLDLDFTTFDWSCRRYLERGSMMPADGIEQLRGFDAMVLGAVGWPGVPDHVSLWGLLIPIRRAFEQYVNLRPVRGFRGVQSPLVALADKNVDLLIIRENNEGEYSEIGGRFNRGLPGEIAIQESVFTRAGISRVADFAVERAAARRGLLTSATKSNGIVHSMPLWDEVIRERASNSPIVELTEEHIDALAAKLVLDPLRFDVIVASNLFGDILSDLAAAVAGSIGIAPSANLDPSGTYPSMFEPVHGSAPDIAGLGIANPVGMLLSVALMLDHLDSGEASKHLTAAVEQALADPATRTRDIGGTATTEQMTAAVVEAIRRPMSGAPQKADRSGKWGAVLGLG